MSEFGQNLKTMVKKSIEAIGNSAGNLAANTRQKVEEFNIAGQLRDIYTEIGEKVFMLSKQGTAFPDELSEALNRAAETEKELDLIRKRKEDTVEKEPQGNPCTGTQESDTAKDETKPSALEYTAENDHDVPVISVEENEEEDFEIPENNPLSSAINDLFENMPPVDKMVDKVNSSLDDLGESLRRFSGEFDKQLSDFADQMMGKKDNDQ